MTVQICAHFCIRYLFDPDSVLYFAFLRATVIYIYFWASLYFLIDQGCLHKNLITFLRVSLLRKLPLRELVRWHFGRIRFQSWLYHPQLHLITLTILVNQRVRPLWWLEYGASLANTAFMLRVLGLQSLNCPHLLGKLPQSFLFLRTKLL